MRYKDNRDITAANGDTNKVVMMMEKEEQSLLVFYDTELSKKTITQVRFSRIIMLMMLIIRIMKLRIKMVMFMMKMIILMVDNQDDNAVFIGHMLIMFMYLQPPQLGAVCFAGEFNRLMNRSVNIKFTLILISV